MLGIHKLRWNMLFALFTLSMDIAKSYKDCSEYFKYERHVNQWVGIISVPPGVSNILDLAAHFSLRGSVPNDILSSLNPHPNRDTVIHDLMHNYTASFSVLYVSGNDHNLPKLVKMKINGQTFCNCEGYSRPSSTLIRIKKYIIEKTDNNTAKHLGNIKVVIPRLSELISGKPPVIASSIYSDLSNDNNGRTSIMSCGNKDNVPLIHGGRKLIRGRFPWLVAIYRDSSLDPSYTNLKFKCGASLVTESKVITAAHCVHGFDRQKIRAFLGRYDLSTISEDGAVMKEIDKIVIHPEFVSPIVPEVDIAILTLTTPAIFTFYIGPICLWKHELGSNYNENAFVAGWGIDETQEITQYPKTVNVQTVSPFTCLKNNFIIHKYVTTRTLCSSNIQAHGPCVGDSGGPLMITQNGSWWLRGIISFGSRIGRQCDLGRYVIYCDLSKHIDWINKNIR